jgi:hypothetical protein
MPTALQQEVSPPKVIPDELLTACERDGVPSEFFRDSSDLLLKSFSRSSQMRERVLESLEELLDIMEL